MRDEMRAVVTSGGLQEACRFPGAVTCFGVDPRRVPPLSQDLVSYDWHRIQEEFHSTVQDILNSTLASREPLSEEDKEMLQRCLKNWQEETFNIAKPNISVNGQDLENYVPETEETEPFDELLVRRRQASTEEQLVWDKTLADRRRKAPKEVERVVEDLLMRQRAAIPAPMPLKPMAAPEIEDIPRWDDVVETHKETIASSSNLIKEEQTLMQRAQKAKKVAQTIASLPPQ
ncbi:hypothetical protein CTheo_149 [Ceratobasidium theobromae]|uniref:Uncharacterized protein n=1 Tax=Ceratobasidium theobromae TaxID=1582974 RepID=A0A5N5QXP2_9AGAM|nr:hypothetical protein CTheo_149 [Ceratobasidium theobromae]